MRFIDTHAHLDEEAFAQDRADVIARSVEANVLATITIGTTAESSQRAVALAEEHPTLYAAVGIQPNYVSQAKPGDWELIEELAVTDKVVAIGETGLDRYWDYAPLTLQNDYFDRHIGLSSRLNLPFVVHCREAEQEVVAQLRQSAEHAPLKGVMHSFSGALETAQACLALGLYISFAGMVTYKSAGNLRSVAAQIPLDRLLIETDAPYLAPVPRRGKRNEPAFVQHTAACLADVFGLSVEEIAQKTTENAVRLFSLPVAG